MDNKIEIVAQFITPQWFINHKINDEGHNRIMDYRFTRCVFGWFDEIFVEPGTSNHYNHCEFVLCEFKFTISHVNFGDCAFNCCVFNRDTQMENVTLSDVLFSCCDFTDYNFHQCIFEHDTTFLQCYTYNASMEQCKGKLCINKGGSPRIAFEEGTADSLAVECEDY